MPVYRSFSVNGPEMLAGFAARDDVVFAASASLKWAIGKNADWAATLCRESHGYNVYEYGKRPTGRSATQEERDG